MSIVNEFKKGWSTSEFWVMAVTTVAPLIALLSGYDVDVEGAVGLIGIIFGGIGYATNRTWLKRKRIEGVVAQTTSQSILAIELERDDTEATLLDGVVDGGQDQVVVPNA